MMSLVVVGQRGKLPTDSQFEGFLLFVQVIIRFELKMSRSQLFQYNPLLSYVVRKLNLAGFLFASSSLMLRRYCNRNRGHDQLLIVA